MKLNLRTKILIKVEIILQMIIILIIKEEKIKLNTVIVKRENNPNFIGNKAFFNISNHIIYYFDNFHLLNEK